MLTGFVHIHTSFICQWKNRTAIESHKPYIYQLFFTVLSLQCLKECKEGISHVHRITESNSLADSKSSDDGV
jgi:hypothetical protein